MAVFAVYSRKSKVTERGESIENQVELCKRYIRGNFLEEEIESITVYEDEGFSGGSTNRPAFLRLRAEAELLGITHIVCYRLDRISRNISDFARLIEEFRQKNIQFVSIKEQFDTGTPIGRAMMYIASVFSQLERETIAERIRDNMAELAKSGRWLGGNTPLGFRSERVMGNKKSVYYKLVPVPSELATVNLIFDTYEELCTLSGTERAIAAKGILTPRGKKFSRLGIKKILENPVYGIADGAAYDYFEAAGALLCAPREAFDGTRGIMAYNKTRGEAGGGAVAGGKVQRATAMPQWIVAVGEHCGIIGGKRRAELLRLLLQGSPPRKRGCASASSAACGEAHGRPKGRLGLLAGRVRCPLCGSPMGAKAGSAHGSYYYRCSQKGSNGNAGCNAENINGVALDAFVIEQAASFLSAAARQLSPPQLSSIKNACTKTYDNITLSQASSNAAKSPKATLAKLTQKLEKTENISEIREIIGKMSALTEEISATPKANANAPDTPEKPPPDRLQNLCGKELIIEMFNAINVEQKRAVLECILTDVVIDKPRKK